MSEELAIKENRLHELLEELQQKLKLITKMQEEQAEREVELDEKERIFK